MKETMRTIMALMLACMPLMAQAQTTELNCWTTKGEPFKLPKEDVLAIGDTVAAIDLRGVRAVSLDCGSANPNCLYYTDGASRVGGLPSANVVYNGRCDGLLLTDEAGFFCPIAFTVADAMLRLTPRYDDGGDEPGFFQPCHETVILPFEADFVLPANVNGTMPDGWLQTACYVGHDDNQQIFCQAEANPLAAYTPYLVQFAYGAYGTQILFCGQNKRVVATKAVTVSDGSFWFTGITTVGEEAPEFFRYHRGLQPCFVHTGDGKRMEPFRCFIVAADEMYGDDDENPTSGESTTSGDIGKVLDYTIVAPEATSLSARQTGHGDRPHDPGQGQESVTVIGYGLSGRQVSAGSSGKGVYIVGGRKVIRQ